MIRLRRAFTVALLAALFLACSCKGPLRNPLDAPPAAPVVSAAPQWDDVFDRHGGWTGGDVAASFTVPGGRTLWVFGDSWIGDVEDNRHVRATLVNNAIAVHPYDPARPSAAPDPDAAEFLWGPADEKGQPSAWVRPPAATARELSAEKAWYWPTGGGVVITEDGGDQRLALFLILLTKAPGPDSVWSFQCAGSAVAVIDNVEEPAEQWAPRVIDLPHRFSFAGDDHDTEVDWGMAALASQGPRPWVYVYGTAVKENNRRDLLIARVRPADFDDFGEWDFLGGRGAWEQGPAAAAPILHNVASELSVDRVPHRFGGVSYVMVYSEPLLGDRVFVRMARAPQGPWSEVQPIFTVAEIQRSPNFFTYAAKGHGALSEPGTLLVSYIVNSHDFFELAADAAIYRPRFISLELPSPPGSRRRGR